ncbi:MAG TPA: hypothetical protein ENI23_15960 [bacterium]|nr:hypothetical protein [bacterium]
MKRGRIIFLFPITRMALQQISGALKKLQVDMLSGQSAFPTGKHEGKRLDWIVENDPSYVEWLMEQEWMEIKYKAEHEYFENEGF